jgi:hypothetical protein
MVVVATDLGLFHGGDSFCGGCGLYYMLISVEDGSSGDGGVFGGGCWWDWRWQCCRLGFGGSCQVEMVR